MGPHPVEQGRTALLTQMGSSARSPARSLPHQDLEEDGNATAVSHHFYGTAPLLPPAHPSFSVWGWWGNWRKCSDPAGPPGPPPAPLAAPQAAAPRQGQAAGHQVINDSGERGATRTPAPAGETAAEVPDLPKSCCCCTDKAENPAFLLLAPSSSAPGCCTRLQKGTLRWRSRAPCCLQRDSPVAGLAPRLGSCFEGAARAQKLKLHRSKALRRAGAAWAKNHDNKKGLRWKSSLESFWLSCVAVSASLGHSKAPSLPLRLGLSRLPFHIAAVLPVPSTVPATAGGHLITS